MSSLKLMVNEDHRLSGVNILMYVLVHVHAPIITHLCYISIHSSAYYHENIQILFP